MHFNPNPYTPILERIERNTQRMADDECWISDYKPASRGYVNLSHLGVTNSLHRIAWEAHNAEPIPPGMYVCHTCDNPLCFNPQHLFLGTPQDNMDDKCRKGRHRAVSTPVGDRKRDARGRFIAG